MIICIYLSIYLYIYIYIYYHDIHICMYLYTYTDIFSQIYHHSTSWCLNVWASGEMAPAPGPRAMAACNAVACARGHGSWGSHEPWNCCSLSSLGISYDIHTMCVYIYIHSIYMYGKVSCMYIYIYTGWWLQPFEKY